MKKRLWSIGILLLLSMMLFFACQNTGFINLKAEVNDLKSKMSDQFKNVEGIITDFKNIVSGAVLNPDIDKVDISKMDEKDGGKFYLFQNQAGYMYLKKYDAANLNELNLMVLGATPLTDLKKKKLFTLSQNEQKIIELYNKSSNIMAALGFIGTPEEDIALSFPRLDIAALFPPGLDFTNFPWFGQYLAFKNDIAPILPTTSIGPLGIIQGVGTGIWAGEKGIGVTYCDLAILKLTEEILMNSKNITFIAYKDTNVFGASKKAKDEIKIKVMKDFDYLQQLKDNPQFNEEFRLNNEKQNKDIQELAKIIKPENIGNEKLNVTINGKKYKIFITELEKYGYFIVGLI